MVDKIIKALNKFTQKEKKLVKILLLKIKNILPFISPLKVDGQGVGFDLKKLKGRNDVTG